MYQTLVVIHFGWLLAIWAVATTALAAWSVRHTGWGRETRDLLVLAAVLGA